MEFYFRRITISSYIIVCILLKHASTGGVQIDVDCMVNAEPYCCRTKCEWNEKPSENFTDAECIVKGKTMECKINTDDKIFSTPLIPNGVIVKDARCKISNRDSDYVVSCYYYKSKPICCETPCKWELNFDNATCEMTNTKIDCRHGTGDKSKHMELCFERGFCPHKPENTECHFGLGDMCYINIDGKGQEQEQVSSDNEKQIKPKDVITPTVTEATPSNQTDEKFCWIFGITISICITFFICCGTAYCLRKKCIICCSCSVKNNPGQRTVSNNTQEMATLNPEPN